MIFFPPTQTLSCEEYFSDNIDYSLTVTIIVRQKTTIL